VRQGGMDIGSPYHLLCFGIAPSDSGPRFDTVVVSSTAFLPSTGNLYVFIFEGIFVEPVGLMDTEKKASSVTGAPFQLCPILCPVAACMGLHRPSMTR
jgi:hypothetical protein